jgi:hypothetical protein
LPVGAKIATLFAAL